MTTLTFQSVARGPHPSLTDRLVSTLLLWRDRMADRAELARWDDRELHDAGISRSDIANELRKPFWRG